MKLIVVLRAAQNVLYQQVDKTKDLNKMLLVCSALLFWNTNEVECVESVLAKKYIYFHLDVSYLCFYLSLFSDFSSVSLNEETPSQADYMFYFCHFSLLFLKKCWQI